jgi:hypothetical protein
VGLNIAKYPRKIPDFILYFMQSFKPLVVGSNPSAAIFLFSVKY